MTIYYMNTYTGSVDTEENWFSDAMMHIKNKTYEMCWKGISEDYDKHNQDYVNMDKWLVWEDSQLVQVTKDEDGEWVEV